MTFQVARLLAKPIKVEIDGEEVEIPTLDLDNLDVAYKIYLDDINVQAEAYRELLVRTIMKMDPTAKREDVLKMGLIHVMKILNAILKANNISEEDLSEEQKEKILNRFKRIK